MTGKKPNSLNWGAEATEDYGTLYTDMNGIITNKVIPSIPGNYGVFYEKMADAILNHGPVPTSAKEGTNIIRVLEAARNSAFNKRVVGV
jgi:scyllo-inositol 2-dehydrogenase (NADP+)